MEPYNIGMNNGNEQRGDIAKQNKTPRSGDKGLFRIVLERVYGYVKVVLHNNSGTEIGTVANPVNVTGTVTGTVPLPPGASTAVLQTAGNSSLTTIAAKDFATQTTLALVKTAVDSILSAQAGLAQEQEATPTAVTRLNPSVTLGYTGTQLTTIVKTIDANTYTKTLSYTGTQLTGISEWVEA